MSDNSEDAVIPTLNQLGHLEFRCKGLREEDVCPITLAAGAGNAYLLCLYDIYVACGPNRESQSGFEACLRKWKANPLHLKLIKEREVKYGVTNIYGRRETFAEWSIAKYFFFSMAQEAAGSHSVLADALLKEISEPGDDFFRDLQRDDVKRVLQHSEAKAKAAKERAEAEARATAGAKGGPQGGGEGQAAAGPPTPAEAAGPSGSGAAAAVGARRAEIARGEQPVPAVGQGGGEGQAAAEPPAPAEVAGPPGPGAAAVAPRRVANARGKQPVPAGRLGNTAGTEDAVMQDPADIIAAVRVPVTDSTKTPRARGAKRRSRQQQPAGSSTTSGKRPKRQPSPKEMAQKELRDAQKAVDEKKKAVAALDADIAQKELEVAGLKETRTSEKTLLAEREAIRDIKAEIYRQFGGSSSR